MWFSRGLSIRSRPMMFASPFRQVYCPQLQPYAQYHPFRKYSKGAGGSSGPEDAARSGGESYESFKAELQEGIRKGLEEGFAPTNDSIRELGTWIRGFVGIVIAGFGLKISFYDHYTQERLIGKIKESEERITTVVGNSMSKLKHELKVESRGRLWRDPEKGPGGA